MPARNFAIWRISSSLSLKPGMKSVTISSHEDVVEFATELAIVLVVKTFQVNLVEIHPRFDVVEDFFRAVAVGHVGSVETMLTRLLKHLDGPLAGDEWFVVRAGHRLRALLEGEPAKLLRVHRHRRRGAQGVAQGL